MRSVTLGGVGSTAGTVKLRNVAPGALTSTSTDAVNGSQLNATNQRVTQNETNITNIEGQVADAVVYDTPDHGMVTFGGAEASSPVVLGNVAAGTVADNAVNVGQLNSAGFQVDGSTGAVLNKAATYDVGSVESGDPTITLDPGSGYSSYFRNSDRGAGLLPAGTRISNVAAGVQDTDAANVGQVFDIMNSTQPNLMVLAASQRVMDAAMDGGAGVDTTNLKTSYATAAWYSQVKGMADQAGSTGPSDVARAIGNGSIAMGSNTLSTGNAATALGVQSYASADDSVALGSGSVANQANTVSVGSDGTGYTAYDPTRQPYTIQNAVNTRRIVNMAAGQDSTDAVNVSQLNSAGFQVDGSTGAVLNKAATYDVGSVESGDPTITLDPGSGYSTYFRNSDRGAGLLPAGTRISNVAAGVQDTDAANVGQVFDIMNATQPYFANPTSPALMMASDLRIMAPASGGAGIDTTNLKTSYATAAWYSQVKGLANQSGSTGPSDVARAIGSGSIAIGSNTLPCVAFATFVSCTGVLAPVPPNVTLS